MKKERQRLSECFILIFPRITMDFGDNKTQVAEKMGTHPNVINEILKGKRLITIPQLNTLIKTYHLSRNYFFNGGGELYAITPAPVQQISDQHLIENIGSRYKIIREMLGLSQVEMARQLNIAQPNWSAIENNELRPSDNVKKILHTLHQISYEFMLNGHKPIKRGPSQLSNEEITELRNIIPYMRNLINNVETGNVFK